MDRATRSAAYDNSAAVADSAGQLARWKSLSAAVRDKAERDVPYGPLPRNRIDIFAAPSPEAPLLVFIHGGYWQRNAKEDFACMACGPLAKGFAVALVGYTLAPEASLTAIVAETRAAVAHLVARDASAGVRRPIIVAGWSAGGHLAGLASRWPGVAATLPISGIFDLAPLRGTVIDDKVGLSEKEADALSPLNRLADTDGAVVGPMVVAYGDRELPELCRQSREFQAACVERGIEATLLPVAAADHFSVLDGLIDPSGALTQALVGLAARLR